MPVKLPFVPSLPFYRFGTDIEGVEYLFDVRWNGREGAWFFDLLDVEENPIARGVRITLGTFLGGRSAHADFPPGVFVASDLSNSGIEPGLDDLNSRVAVYFLTSAELALLPVPTPSVSGPSTVVPGDTGVSQYVPFLSAVALAALSSIEAEELDTVAFDSAVALAATENPLLTHGAAFDSAVGLAATEDVEAEEVVVSGSQVFVEDDTFTIPENVTEITAECWGAGGGGGDNDTTAPGGGGGGAGAYARSVLSVTSGNDWTVVVGAAGAPGDNGNGGDGGDSSFTRGGTTVVAVGGSGGEQGAADPFGGDGGAGGLASASTGDTKWSGGGGGDAGNGDGAAFSGGGGGGAPAAGDGNDGQNGNSELGSGGSGGAGMGRGGKGGDASSGIGDPGAWPGGGGGGAGGSSTRGAGARGAVRVSWGNKQPGQVPSGMTNVVIHAIGAGGSCLDDDPAGAGAGAWATKSTSVTAGHEFVALEGKPSKTTDPAGATSYGSVDVRHSADPLRQHGGGTRFAVNGVCLIIARGGADNSDSNERGGAAADCTGADQARDGGNGGDASFAGGTNYAAGGGGGAAGSSAAGSDGGDGANPTPGSGGSGGSGDPAGGDGADGRAPGDSPANPGNTPGGGAGGVGEISSGVGALGGDGFLSWEWS